MITLETINETEQSERTTIVSFDYEPTNEEINSMLSIDESIVVEF